MAEFPANPSRLDPYKASSFRVKWDGRYVAAIIRVSPLVRETAAVAERSGGDPTDQHVSPGSTTWPSIVLERGRTQDTAFEDWANFVWDDGKMSLKNLRKEVTIELEDEQGAVVMAFVVHRAWPTEYVALGQLDASSEETLVERLTLAHEGWERDTSVRDPVET
ncbi:MAG TPA: phage tail protein [Gaiellaceae bacterium]|jgi:phage tail-like protein|nr:phage tail protein [Gaiellaceae bacterium]